MAIFRSFVLACKSDKAPDDGRFASATTISVFQTHAEPESARLRTTSVEPLRLENFGRSLFILIYPSSGCLAIPGLFLRNSRSLRTRRISAASSSDGAGSFSFLANSSSFRAER